MSALRLGAHAGTPLQTVSFSYFSERNLVLAAFLGKSPLKKGDLGGFKNQQMERIYDKDYSCVSTDFGPFLLVPKLLLGNA